MEMYKVVLKSDTAFFRNDITSTSYQETFNCPPLSAIYGLMAAAYGDYRYDVDVGYIFNYQFKTTDYELIMRKDSSKKDLYKKYISDDRFDRNDILRGCSGTIPIKREILFNCELILYIEDEEVAKSFEKPYYALLLGRSEDLAKVVCKPKKVKLREVDKPVNFGKSIIPFEEGKMIPGRLSKLNIEISETYPRVVKRAGIFNIVDRIWSNQNLSNIVQYDPENKLGIYIHKGKLNVS